MFEDFKTEFINQIQSYYGGLIELLPKLLLAISILIVFIFIASRVASLLRKRLTYRMEDPLLAKFIARIAKWALIIVGLMLALNVVQLGNIAGGLLAGAGVTAFVVGFAFKDIGENFLAGILLAFSRPFQVGHTIESGGMIGNVVALDLRNTQIKTFDGKDIFMPNNFLIKNPLINYTIDGFLRQDFQIGLDYGSDVSKASELILSILNYTEGVLQEDKKASVNISTLGDSAIILNIFYWLDTFDTKKSGLVIKTEVVDKCLTELTKAGFNLPGNVLELKNYGGSKLAIDK